MTKDSRSIHSAMMAMDPTIRGEIIKMARKGRLVDECFREFQRTVFPGAPAEQVHMLRVAFFAGAAELHSVQMYGLDPGSMQETDEDLDFYGNVVDEISSFHKRTMDAYMRKMKTRGEA